MSQNILKTEQGSAFFVDFEQVIADEKINIEKAKKKSQEHKKHSGGTALYIPLFENSSNKKAGSSSAKAPQNENSTSNNLNLTFTKQDFEQLRSKAVFESCKNRTLSSPCTPSGEDARSRPSSSIQRIKATMGTLKKVHSSPDLLSSPRLPQLEKSHQELKELITEYDKKGKGCFQEVFSTTYARLPKLPQSQWTSKKQMSLDSSLDINKTVMEFDGSTKQENILNDHQVQIEELYSDLNSKVSRNQSNFPPIFKPTTTVVPKSQGSNKSNIKKSTKKYGSQNLSATFNRNKSQTNNGARKSRSITAQRDTRLPKNSLSKKKKKGRKKSKNKEPSQTVNPEEETDIVKNNIQEILDDIELKLDNNVHSQQGDKISSDNNEQFSMEGSIEVFYDNVLNAKPTIETTTVFPFPNVSHSKLYQHNKMNEMKQELIGNNADLYNTFEKFTKSKYEDGTNTNNRVFDFNLVESMEKTLSIDDTFFMTTPKNQNHQQAFNLFPGLSNVTEEKSPFTTIQSKSNINSKLLLSSHNISSDGSSAMSKSIETLTNGNLSEGHFDEITNLVFQPGGGGIISESSSLDSISINNSITSSSSNNATLTERPYLRSVLGQTSARSLYTSSSNISDESSLSDGILEWQKGKVIDRGAFGVVYQGLTNAGQMIAVKEVNINQSKNANKVCFVHYYFNYFFSVKLSFYGRIVLI